MSASPARTHESWSGTGLGAALGVGWVWALAFATAELAWFIPANESWPVGPAHAVLWVILVAQFGLLASGAALAGALVGRWRPVGAAVTVLAAPAVLLFVLAVSLYRDHTLVHTRPTMNVVTAAALPVWGLALLLATRAASYRPAAATLRTLRGTGLLALAVGVVALVANGAAPDSSPAEYVTPDQVGEVPDTGLRVLIVGIDGGSWSVLDPLLESGRMPALTGLAERGVTARLESIIPTYSPNLWTSIASGKTLEKHGVSSHVFTRMPLGLPPVPHMPRQFRHLTKMLKLDVRLADRAGLLPLGLYASGNVRTRRLWEIVEGFGMRFVGLEWYVTHPVEPVLGVQVSDRFHLLEGDALRTAVHPDSLAPVLEPFLVRPADVMDRVVAMAEVGDLDAAGREELKRSFPEEFRTLAAEMSRDLTTAGIVPAAFAQVPDWQLGAVYYRGMDGSHHVTWKYRDLPPDAAASARGQRLRSVVDSYNAFCDGLLERTLQHADSATVVIALSDHGWEDTQWAHARKPDGFFVMAGGPVIASRERAAVSVYDVAPTVLALLGIPVPEDMDGRVARELVDPAFWERFPIRTVPSYEAPREARATAENAAADEQILEQLRALGYVGQ
ncbi:MAG: alkaline phosphatase family protein [Candidatus Eiseniibacteriota bacterium]